MIRRLLITVGVSFLLLGFGSAAVAQESPEEQAAQVSGLPELNFDITLGGAFRDISGDKASRFQQGRDVPQSFFLRNFYFNAETPGRPWQFTLRGEDAGQRDQHFRLKFERFGRHRLQLRWDQFPFFVADNIQTLHVATSKGVLEVPDLIQTQFQAAGDTELQSLMPGVLSTTPFGRLQILRRRLGLDYEYSLTKRWRVLFNFGNEIRSGDRHTTVGSYSRTFTAQGDLFFTPGIEVPEPVDHRTTEFGAGLAYEAERGFFRADYQVSLFRNRTGTLTFDNPFRITDELASRGRYQRTQVDLFPDNDVHTITLQGGYSFKPWDTRVRGLLGFSSWEQNDPFLPFTLNTSLVAADLAPGVTPTDLEALPQRSLNGNVNVLHGDAALNTRPSESLRISFRYNTYDWDNRSDEILFPGFGGVGDSRWEEAHAGLPIANRLQDFTRQRSTAELIWSPRRMLSWKNKLEWEGWNRDNRTVARTNDWSWKSQAIVKSKKWFYGKLNYRYSDRIPLGAYDSRKDFVQLRQFDVAHRIRHEADVLFQINPSLWYNFSGSYGYRSSRFDDRLYGLTTHLQGFFTVDFNLTASDRFAMYTNFTRERYQSTANLIGKTGAVNYNPPNTFIRDINDLIDSLGVGFDANFLDQRLNWNVSYAFAFSRIAHDTFNPFTVDTEALLSATAFPLPDISEKFHEIRTALSYRVRDNVEVGLQYLLEPRTLHDFTTDIFGSPYIAGTDAPESSLARYLFVDARQGSYHGNAAAAYIRYQF